MGGVYTMEAYISFLSGFEVMFSFTFSKKINTISKFFPTGASCGVSSKPCIDISKNSVFEFLSDFNPQPQSVGEWLGI